MIELIKNDTTGQPVLRITGEHADDGVLYITLALDEEDLKNLKNSIDVELEDKEMTLNEYQDKALSKASIQTDPDETIFVRTLGLAGEIGEVCDLIKKHYGHGHDLSLDKIKDELGDVLWYIATLADCYNLTLHEIAEGNCDKLNRRYPDGFSQEGSINRVDSNFFTE